MGVTSKPSGGAFVGRSLDVVVQRQTYRNLLNLLLVLPLGLLYFSVLTTGFLLGLGLIVALVGIPLLLTLFVGSRYLVAFERWLAVRLLDLDIPAPEVAPPGKADKLWPRERSLVFARSTWAGIGFLYARFVLGLVSFPLVSILLGASIVLVTAPLHYTSPDVGLVIAGVRIDTLEEAIVAVPVGLIAGVCSLHILDAAARLSGRFAEAVLSREVN